MKRSNKTFDKTQSKYWNQNRLWPLSLPICEEILSEKCDSGDKMGVLLVVSFYCVYIKCLLYGWVYICFQLQIRPLLLRWNSIAHGEIHISKTTPPTVPYVLSSKSNYFSNFTSAMALWQLSNKWNTSMPSAPSSLPSAKFIIGFCKLTRKSSLFLARSFSVWFFHPRLLVLQLLIFPQLIFVHYLIALQKYQSSLSLPFFTQINH